MLDEVPSSVGTELQLDKSLVWVVYAFVLLITSHVVRALTSLCSQVLDRAVPKFELNALRFGILLVAFMPIIIKKKVNVLVPKAKVPFLLLSVSAANIQNLCYYVATEHTHVRVLSAMVASIAIALNTLASICIKAERSIYLFIGAVMAITGLIFMAQPAFLFSSSASRDVKFNWTSPCVHEIFPDTSVRPHKAPNMMSDTITHESLLLILLSSFFIVLQVHCLKKVIVEGQMINPLITIFWTAVIGTICSLTLMTLLEKPVLLTLPHCIALLLLHCIGVEQSLVVIQWSIQYLLPSILTMAYSVGVIVQLIGEITLLKDMIHPAGTENWMDIVGSILCSLGVLAGSLIHILREKHDSGLEEKKPLLDA